MRTKASRIFGALAVVLAVCGANLAQAVQYPPGGPGCTPPLVCADTLIKVSFIQNPAAAPHPVAPDTVWGIGGIITGFDTFPTGFAFYVQNSQGGPWTGVDVFTGGTNYVGNFTPALALGDSVMCYGRLDEFQGGTELRGFGAGAFADPLVAVRRISQGNALPPFRRTTVHELYELPTNLAAEQWEGCLVRVKDKLRIVRNSEQVPLGTFSSMLAVDNTVCPNGSLGPCDTLFIDGSTMSFTAVSPLPVPSFVDSVQGIYDQRTRGYRIQLRNSDDLFDASPPGLAEAYFIAPDTIRCVFDRPVTNTSAINVNNYTIGSTLGPPTSATRQAADHRFVHLKVTTGLSPGDPQSITANGLVNERNNQVMTVADVRNMFDGVVPIATVQAPDPAALAGSPCDDRSKFAGAGAVPGDRITIRGVCLAGFGSTYFVESASGGVRSGITLFAPIAALVPGHEYILAGAIQEFFAETEFVSNVYVNDLGAVAPGVPAAVVQTVSVLRDTTCDAAQSLFTGEDYEHMLVKVINVKTTENASAGQSFFVAQPYPTWAPDSILIDNNIVRSYDPVLALQLDVTGVLDLSFGTWRIQPRGNSDIVPTSVVAGVDPTPTRVSFAITPNPARTAKVTFALPKRDHVKIAVYDIVGRKLAVLADGEFPAGPGSVDWDGRDVSGHSVGAGMYFYKMTVGGETLERRGILLN